MSKIRKIDIIRNLKTLKTPVSIDAVFRLHSSHFEIDKTRDVIDQLDERFTFEAWKNLESMTFNFENGESFEIPRVTFPRKAFEHLKKNRIGV